ncbi:tetratricopeptide repeat protein [Nostoc sp. LEGE 12447]|uniref:tetratricopeptide repeat protein n=1 Tax=Nostoc sp. LEGE 12447 TaxID=1828640 RepID=UPI00188454DE|nr:tetratricopeptide repeat protein [Nostoc sp. LEGE 12447]MBE9001080.1 tetratricopeptide repeat protein [Nostoc sp. LEGE 12447]
MIYIRKTVKLVLILAFAIITLPLSTVAQTVRIHSISGQGKVRVQREKRTEWIPVRQYIDLYQGDQILPDRGVRVYVKCPPDYRNLVLVKAGVPSGLGSICISWANQDTRGSQAEETIGGIDPSIPYLITPRHSLLLTATPLIRWNKVSGAKEYTVEVTDPTGLMWRTKTRETQLVYAGKPLKPGVSYSIVVQTDTGKSSEDDAAPNAQKKAANLGFRILRKSEAALVQVKVAKISPTPLDNEASALTVADFYSNYVLPQSVIQAYNLSANTFETYSLTSDAIAILESLLQQGKQSLLIYRTLGDLYWQTGLIRPAEANYLKAISLVQGLEDLEDWTLAQYSLGQLYAAIDNPKQAVEYYSQARLGYIFLGDSTLAEVLQRRIDRFKKTAVNDPSIKK